jgi:hypothetical protein
MQLRIHLLGIMVANDQDSEPAGSLAHSAVITLSADDGCRRRPPHSNVSIRSSQELDLASKQLSSCTSASNREALLGASRLWNLPLEKATDLGSEGPTRA